MGAWIEINKSSNVAYTLLSSHPLWVRGLKLKFYHISAIEKRVAPFMGAWIEICMYNYDYLSGAVAPFMGAWIEMLNLGYII